jgi:hypothetical protein
MPMSNGLNPIWLNEYGERMRARVCIIFRVKIN